MLPRLLSICFLLTLVPAFAAEGDFWIGSRGVDIPVTIKLPVMENDERVPLVVLVHGHGGSRQENGGFERLAGALAKNGMASVRMDFPGCGDSTEGFAHNNITNMLHDIEASLQFALAWEGIDATRVGILGYSMGGRLAMLSAGDDFSAMVLWAPVAREGGQPMFKFLGGEQNYNLLRSQAERNGSALLTTPWGQRQNLGMQWFLDMEQRNPIAALRAFDGPVLILHGSADATIDPDNAVVARDASADAELAMIDGAGHGFGFFNDKPDARAYLLAETVAFFKATLAAD